MRPIAPKPAQLQPQTQPQTPANAGATAAQAATAVVPPVHPAQIKSPPARRVKKNLTLQLVDAPDEDTASAQTAQANVQMTAAEHAAMAEAASMPALTGDAGDAFAQAAPVGTAASNEQVAAAAAPNSSMLMLGGLAVLGLAAGGGGKSEAKDTSAPTFSSGTTASVAENTPPSTVLYTVKATDNTAVTAYRLKANAADNAAFALDEKTGELRFKSSPDFETKNSYTAQIEAVDAAGNVAVQSVTVNVSDVDDTAPVFTAGATATASVTENTTAVAYTPAATDNVGVTGYAFAEGGADNDKFKIDATTGALTFLAVPDFEAPASAAGTNAYSVKIKAVDAAGNVAVQSVTVTVNDVDDTAPVFIAGPSAIASVAENAAGAAYTPAATDNVAVTGYAFADGGADNSQFKIDATTGALIFLAVPDFEAPASAASTNAYSVKIKAVDAAGNAAVQTVTVSVSNIRETVSVSGTDAADTQDYSGNGSDNYRLSGGAGNDMLKGGDGDDVLRGGAGVDHMDGGTGNDAFVVVGDVSGGGKVDTLLDQEVLGFAVRQLNGQNLNEDEDGAVEIIRGGDGVDTLYVYGTADLTKYDLTGIEHFVIRSDVTFTVEMLSAAQSVQGDGSSTIRIRRSGADTSTSVRQLDLSQVQFAEIGQIDVGENVQIVAEAVAQLGGANALIGNGSLLYNGPQTSNFSGIVQSTSFQTSFLEGSPINGIARVENVITDTDESVDGEKSNDFLRGTDARQVMRGDYGSDIIMGNGGNDEIYGDLSLNDTAANLAPTVLTGGQPNHLVNGLGGVAGFGENVLARNDDGSSTAIDISAIFGADGIDFFGQKYTSIYVNNNGNITFNRPLSTFTPGVITAGNLNPIVAAFWADVDTRNASTLTATPGGASTGTNSVYYDIDSVNRVFTATWDDVGFFSGNNTKLNAFQIQLKAQEGGKFDIVYRYENIDWVTGDASSGANGLGGVVARAGFSAGLGQGIDYYEMPQSGNQTQMLDLDQSGPYLFKVSSGVALATGTADQINGGAGDDILIGGLGNDTISGGSSWDTAKFSGRYGTNGTDGDYNITSPAGADYWLVQDKRPGSPDGTDKVFKDVEKFVFSDKPQGVSKEIQIPFGSTENLYERSTAKIFGYAEDVEAGEQNGLIHDAAVNTFNSGMIRTLADFSKAAYHLQDWENFTLNDASANAAEAYQSILDTGWIPLDLTFSDATQTETFISEQEIITVDVHDSNVLDSMNFQVTNRMQNGFYTNENAAALVARSNDSLVISFRGTNDNGDVNSSDSGNIYAPDVDHWVGKEDHYALLMPLIHKINAYANDVSNGISHVYVTGHSLGGSMVSKFMSDNPAGRNHAVTFAAPSYAGLNYANGGQVLNIEINDDPVPDTGAKIGRTIHIEGNSTEGGGLINGTKNHSMDFYRQITKSIDSDSWGKIINRTGDVEVIIQASYTDSTDNPNFIVDGFLSGTNTLQNFGAGTLNDIATEDFDIFYGGRGDDVITGGGAKEYFIGGFGNDLIDGQGDDDQIDGGTGDDHIWGGGGNDKLSGNDGADFFRFSSPSEGVDEIIDFVKDEDKLIFLAENFRFNAAGNLHGMHFVSSSNPVPINPNTKFLYNTTNFTLYFDGDGNETGWFHNDQSMVAVAKFTNNVLLTASDIIIMA